MKYRFHIAVLMTVLLVTSFQVSLVQSSSTNTTTIDQNITIRQSSIGQVLDQETQLKGVVVIDDLHENDYVRDDDVTIAMEALEEQGYITRYASQFSSWEEAINASNYLIISAPYANYTDAEIDVVSTWFENTTGNLLISSRGDFSAPHYETINNLLAGISSTVRAQDDNVYTTDPSANQAWYINTDNFNTTEYPELFTNVEQLSFFSPSSISFGETVDILVTAEKYAYQSNEGGDAPSVIYDDTDDDSGGESIPLGVYEEVTIGDNKDRIVALGTTLWSDFDYGDSSADDITFFDNLINFFHQETLNTLEEIPINIDDETAPEVEIIYPHDRAYLSGIINVTTEARDAFGVTNYSLAINGEIVTNSSFYLWDTTKYDDGTYTVTATAKDEAGNIGTTSNIYEINQGYVPVLDDQPKVMTYNIKQSGTFDEWIEVMVEENADIAILVESGDFDDNNDALLNQYTTTLNDMLFDEIPYQSYTMQDISNDYNGITILSRYDIGSNTKLDNLTDDNGNNINIPLPFLHSTITIQNQVVNVIGAHLTCCSGEENWNQREEQQESILNYMDNLGQEPIIYLGDMNSLSPEDVDPENQDVGNDLGTEPIEMVLDHTHPKASKIHRFIDVASEFGTKDVTFIGSILSRIDYIFVNEYFDGLLLNSTTGDTETAYLASDHVSVDAIFDLSNGFASPPIREISSEINDDGTDLNPLSYQTYLIIFVLVPILRKQRRN